MNRNLHLLGATGTTRVEQYDGREHLVVPCVALMETVIHAVNAPSAEFVPLQTLTKAADSFTNKPVVFGHPVRDGKQISANDPEVLAAHGIGTIRNSRVDGNRLLMDAYLDPVKVERIAGAAMLQRYRDGKEHSEISVGAFVQTEDMPGNHNGKDYKAIWRDTAGDHLAFLTGIGACSVANGCGSHRMMERHLVTAEGISTVGEQLMLRACAGELPIEVEAKLLEYAYGKPETEEMRAAIGARHSASDLTVIQSVHDHAVTLGAACEPAWKSLESKSLGGIMTKEERAATITALTGCACSGFTADDVKMLETVSDERLTAFTATTEARKTGEQAKVDAEAAAKAADTKVAETETKLATAETKLKAAEAKGVLTEAEFMAVAPPTLKTLIERSQKADEIQKAELVATLKAAQSEFTEDELKAEPIERLQRMAKAFKLDEPKPDYSGRPVPRTAATTLDDFAPPDSYAAGIKILQARNAN